MFVDNILIHARAGHGGNGSAHLRRLAFNPKGGPDGGDGARGGNVILEVSPHTDNLRHFFYDPKVFAQAGQAGQSRNKDGRAGADKCVPVPPGTLVWRTNASQLSEAAEARRNGDDWLELEAVADLVETGRRFVLASGGKGGKGNIHFKSSTNRAPVESEEGLPGEEGIYLLEMRMIADVGLVGFPNAGKSTLVTRLSQARPKIASYPFTTLEPMVGVMEFPGFSRATVADIPGLIEGAHEDIGLGHEFLRHIMRCRVLLFVVDAAGSEGRDPVEDIRMLRKEIGLYDKDLAAREWMIAANKTDIPEARKGISALRRAFRGREILPVSAEKGEGIPALHARLGERVGRVPG